VRQLPTLSPVCETAIFTHTCPALSRAALVGVAEAPHVYHPHLTTKKSVILVHPPAMHVLRW
jgi:hypothetical protein